MPPKRRAHVPMALHLDGGNVPHVHAHTRTHTRARAHARTRTWHVPDVWKTCGQPAPGGVENRAGSRSIGAHYCKRTSVRPRANY